MTKLSQQEQIKQLQKQVKSLQGNIHRIAEILNAVANRQVTSSSFSDGILIVDLVNEVARIPLSEPDHNPAIDGANLQ